MPLSRPAARELLHTRAISRELLQQMATTAFQTIGSAQACSEGTRPGGVPRILNSCLAYAADSQVVKRRWPHLYTGSDRPRGFAAGAKVASGEPAS
jgi:hypothetical protein